MPTTAVITNQGSISSQGLCNSIFETSYFDNGTFRTSPQTLLSSSRVCQRNGTISTNDTIVIDVTSMSTGLYAVGDVIRISDAFWYYDTLANKFTYSKNRDYDVAISAPSTNPPVVTNFNTTFVISKDPQVAKVRWNCNYLIQMTFTGTLGMCGRNYLELEMVSAKNTQFDSTGLKNNLNYALQDFINNADTSFAYNKKSTTYSMLVNRNYSSTSFGTTSQHLAKAVKALADLGLDGTGQTVIYVKATLTNCAG